MVAIACLHNLAVEFTIPPKAFGGVGCRMLGDEVALSIVYAPHGAPHLPTQVVGVYVHTLATAHVAHG